MSSVLDIAPPSGAASLAARRAVDWLVRNWPPKVTSEVLALEALALLQLCRTVAAPADEAANILETAIARTSPNPRWSEADLSTSLLAAGAALRIGGAIADSAGAYLDAFGDIEREGLLDGPGGALVGLALHGASRKQPGQPTYCAIDLINADRASLRAALDAVEVTSRFGTRAAVSGPCAALLLEGAAMAALRAYDLPLGMRTLRARRYLDGAPSLGLSTGLDFLRLLQGDDGSFGDFDAVLGQLAASGEANGALRLKLPAAVQAVWTMAELDQPHFRIALHALPPPRHSLTGATDAVRRAS